jgi:hypothetical protein
MEEKIMANKTYTVRVPSGTPDITSEQAAAWLDKQFASNAPLAADPGAGERTLRLSLDQDKVKAGARAAEEPEAVFLRRLIASNIRIPEEPDKTEPEAKPKAPVLKGTLRLQPEQVKPVVRLYEAGQSYVIRRALKAPEAVHEAAFTEEEREQLAASATEVINRRAPAKVIENADLIGLATTIVAIEAQKIEAVQAIAERKQRKSEQLSSQQQEQQQPLPREV